MNLVLLTQLSWVEVLYLLNHTQSSRDGLPSRLNSNIGLILQLAYCIVYILPVSSEVLLTFITKVLVLHSNHVLLLLALDLLSTSVIVKLVFFSLHLIS